MEATPTQHEQQLQAQATALKARIFDLSEALQEKDKIIKAVVDATGFNPEEHGQDVNSLVQLIGKQRQALEATEKKPAAKSGKK
ncbi:hypothetical protein LZP69_10690 [Shewanella sp. AS1]|uniref:hypothetical protein n=1 Tax=Shewanella sp. AS1 TaxID=2907626 RepID=UPI001F469525|nr:hypothetical protein [Shewanella sp. AS1]MCE9679627.1 hypothetical protein [Shewanella sp. AS1]